MVREARARIAAGELGPVRLIHGGYLQDWLSTAEDDNWRVDPELGGASRAFADIGSHWCDLAEFITGDRIAAICAQPARSSTSAPSAAPGARSRPAPATARARAVTTEDAATAHVPDARRRAGTLLVSQVSPGRKNHLHVEVACADASVRFEQEQPETLWLGARGANRDALPRPVDARARRRAPRAPPAGHPQGYIDCFDAFVADTYAAIAGATPEGLPLFADGARSARIVDAVLASADAGGWVEI